MSFKNSTTMAIPKQYYNVIKYKLNTTRSMLNF